MVKVLSMNVPKTIKESDKTLEQYRWYAGSLNELLGIQKSVNDMIGEMIDNMAPRATKLMQDTISLEIKTVEALKRLYMLEYSII